MDSPYPDLLEINEQRLRVVTRTASELQAQMEHLHKLRNRLARASICRLSQQGEPTRKRKSRSNSAAAIRAANPRTRAPSLPPR